MEAQATSPTDQWKEQMAYVSGTVLAWGSLLVQLWPFLARFQTNCHIHAFVFAVNQPPSAAELSYRLMAGVLALGAGMIFFGVIHITARGLLLTKTSDVSAPGQPAMLSRIANGTYDGLHFYWRLMAVVMLLAIVFAPIAAAAAVVAERFRLKFSIVISIVGFLVGFPCGVWFGIWLKRRHASLSSPFVFLSKPHRVAACLIFAVLLAFAVELCDTVAVSVDRQLVSRKDLSPLVVRVMLGGNTSDARYLHVTLSGPAGGKALSPIQLQPGIYCVLLRPAELVTGRYALHATYPHIAVSPTLPWFTAEIDEASGFIVFE